MLQIDWNDYSLGRCTAVNFLYDNRNLHGDTEVECDKVCIGKRFEISVHCDPFEKKS